MFLGKKHVLISCLCPINISGLYFTFASKHRGYDTNTNVSRIGACLLQYHKAGGITYPPNNLRDLLPTVRAPSADRCSVLYASNLCLCYC